MRTLINQNEVITGPYRDHAREQNFKQAYDLNSQILVTNTNTQDGNWVKVNLEFRVRDKKYFLTEFFKDGDNNSTKVVVFTDADRKEKEFDTFIDAEKVLAAKISEGLDGDLN